jgi:hypothetical protein
MAEGNDGDAPGGAPPNAGQNTPAPVDPMGVDRDKIVPAVRNAFSLGWSLVELSGRIVTELGETEQRGMRVASLWRVSLSRIALVHARVFATSNTDKTFYAPQEKVPGYLFPSGEDADYIHFSLLNSKGEQEDPLRDFKLYDVTRRAINCLALLYVNPADSLDSDRIGALQEALRRAVGDNATITSAKKDITALVRKLLTAWDGFLRESYYAGGMLPDNDLEIVAYEAGRSMASLSWNITIATLDWERACLSRTVKAVGSTAIEATAATPPDAAESTARDDGVKCAWTSAFRQETIIHLQHDVVALSSALDEAYRAKQQGTPPSTTRQSVDLELPSVSIRAIKQGIEFWRRAVDKTLLTVPAAAHKLELAPAEYAAEYNACYAWSGPMRLALTKQVNIWQTLITGQQSLQAFTTENVAQKLVNEVWEEIQGSLSTDIRLAVTRAEQSAAEMAGDAGKAIRTMFSKAEFLLWPLGVLAVLVVVTGILLVFHGSSGEVAGASGTLGLAGIWAALTGVFKWRDLASFKDQASKEFGEKASATKAAGPSGEASGVTEKLDSMARSFTSDAMNALKNGFGQAQAELDDLNRSVSVAYPLIDYIAVERNRLAGTSGAAAGSGAASGGLDFLKDIVWTSEERVEEMKAIVRAAFGPIALLAYSASQQTEEQKKREANVANRTGNVTAPRADNGPREMNDDLARASVSDIHD